MFSSRAFLNWSGAAALAALSTTAMAHDAPQAVAPSSTEGQMVVKDAATGELRAPTADEASVLATPATSRTAVRRAVAQTLSKTHASGAQGARLTDEFQSYSVAVRQPDGRIKMECFGSPEEAAAAMKAAGTTTAKSSALPTE